MSKIENKLSMSADYYYIQHKVESTKNFEGKTSKLTILNWYYFVCILRQMKMNRIFEIN